MTKVQKNIGEVNTMKRNCSILFVLFVLCATLLIAAPGNALVAADVVINGTAQINSPGTGIIFPDLSSQSGTEGIKFLIALTGVFPSPDGISSYSQPFYGEIRMFAGNFAPLGWAFCDGQLLPISGNEALFSLLGTTYGGNGSTNFALPNLNNRAPVGY